MPTAWKKMLSYVKPLEIKRASTAYNPHLELVYFEGRFLLGTGDAIYSEGVKYRPIVAAFKSVKLKPKLAGLKEVLVLGTGLASTAHILHQRGLQPKIKLVEIDAVVLQWAMEYLPKQLLASTKPIRDDAFQFIAVDKGFYDLIVVDIFFGLVTAPGVFEQEFLENCQRRLAPNGTIVLNAMFSSLVDADLAKPKLEAVFSNVEEIRFGQNRVYVAN